MEGEHSAVVTCTGYAMFVFLPQDRSDFVCTKCKLVSVLEEKVQGLEKQVSTLRCIRENEDFLDRRQDMLLRAQRSEESEQAAQRGQRDGEDIWQHVTSRRRKRSVHVPAMEIQFMLNQNLKNQARRRQRLQRGNESDEDIDTEFSQTTGPSALEIMVLMGQVLAVERQFWARETSTDWWDCIVLRDWDDSQWLRNFRMCKGTSMELCDLLSPALKRQNTRMRAALTVEKRVTIALWKLATPDSYRSVGNQFGVGKSIVGAAVMQVAKAIAELLLPKVVTLGNVQVIVDGFAAIGFPNCGGAIDGTVYKGLPGLDPLRGGGEPHWLTTHSCWSGN
ncbi:uncharacterized protein LOC128827000 [Malaclemys terrapin pileata]|uniref:uncharacterized protein LOC128827000 n=1 Tax=Malaclemys terrapin pileata TaxID=2991368 RepID=UPI0023A79F6A|nr:uncharacterized protein LOC128827000 [Malaclemys terrapin pileata]